MKNTDYCFIRKIFIDNEPLKYLLFKEGLQGIGAYRYLNNMLRHSANYRMRLSFLAVIALDLHTSLRYLLKIIKNYGLFVVDMDEFYSPEVTDLMLRVRIRNYKYRENKLHKIKPQKRSLSIRTELNEVKKNLSITIKELNNCKIASLHACAKINTISQLRLREREKEKRETAFGEIQKSQLAGRNISQQEAKRNETVVLNQADELNQRNGANSENDPYSTNDLNQAANETNQTVSETSPSSVKALYSAGIVDCSEKSDHSGRMVHSGRISQLGRVNSSGRMSNSGRIDSSGIEVNVNQNTKSLQGNGLLRIGNALQRWGKMKLWSNWADKMERDDAYIECIVMHSRLDKRFITTHKQVMKLFKKHVKTHSTSVGLAPMNDVKYYFANYMSYESPTEKKIEKKLLEQKGQELKVVDPYGFKKQVNVLRIYRGDSSISDENRRDRSPPSSPDSCVSNGEALPPQCWERVL